MRSLILCLLGCLTIPVFAIDVEYKVFYANVKRLKDESTEALQFRFRFNDEQTGKPCAFESLYIHTQKKDLPIVVGEDKYFSVPSEKALYWAGAKIRSHGHPADQVCSLASAIETKPQHLQVEYTPEKLHYLSVQYDNFFSTMGSMMAFLMPKNNGLRLQFNSEDIALKAYHQMKSQSDVQGISYQQKQVIVEHLWLQQLTTTVTLPSKPVKVLPNIQR